MTALAFAASGTSLVFFVNCSSDMGSAPPLGDGGIRDGGSDTSSADASDRGPTVIVAHAAPNLSDVRLCFAQRTSASGGTTTILDAPALPHRSDEPMPQANYPGIPVGGAVSMPEVFDYEGPFLVPYAIQAESILDEVDTKADERTCPQMICSGMSTCLKPAEYVELPAIKREDVQGPTLLALVGCQPGTADAGSRCGADYDAGSPGNLRLVPLPLTRLTASPGKLTAQVAQLAPSVSVTAVYVRTTGGDRPTVSDGGVAYLAATPPLAVPLPADMSGYGTTAVGATLGGDAGNFEMTLDVIQKLSSPLTLPDTFLRQPAGFVIIMAGDPDPSVPQLRLQDGAVNADYDGRGLHLLALPTAL